ncbi:MAG: multifunctional CCA addition/repair protein [Casimicrobiaceae bacterium]|nr:multifunctional CCA addition/repair protein [Casimicrobiaceae bacterium]
MKIYLVGGAVRDELLGRPGGDRDWVVVGATPEQMIEQGFRPVGRDFPVFLHPQTGEEYALARTERKRGIGYRGFIVHASPEVTLEEDLARRDLTINAMARASDGRLIDPFGGRLDLERRVLRHVTPAFRDDPLRVLRLARFAARWPDFTVAPETMELSRQIVASGELNALSAERIWKELARGLMEARPSRMLQVLREAGALAQLAPEVDRLYGIPQRADYHPEVDTGLHLEQALDYAAARGWPLPTRFAVLTHDLGKGETPRALWPAHHGHEARSVRLVEALAERWRVPCEVAELARMVAAEHAHLGRLRQMRAATVHDVLLRCDALRRPERFAAMLDACEADLCSRRPAGEPEPKQCAFAAARAFALEALAAIRTVDAAAIARECTERGRKDQIAVRLREARIAALRERCRPGVTAHGASTGARS